MGQYFKRLAHRTGLLDTASHTRQTGPAAVHRDVMEIKQKITSPVDATGYGSGDNKVRVPTNAATIQAEAISERYSADNTKENQDIELSNQESKRLNPGHTEITKPPASDQTVENVFNSNGNMLSATGLLSDSSLITGGNPEPLFSAQHRLLENLISSPSGQQYSESTGSKVPEISGEEKVNELNRSITSQLVEKQISTKDPLSISEISTLVSAHDERTMSSTNASGLSFRAPSPMPEKIPVESNNQNIEIRIGSVTMEVHQKQPKHPPAARSRPNVTSSGFRPGRYYLRGL